MKATELIEALRAAVEKFGDRPVEYHANPQVKPYHQFRPADFVVDSVAFRNGERTESLVIMTTANWEVIHST